MAKELDQALFLINKDLILDPETLPDSVEGIDELKLRLMPIVNYLLNNDMSRLLNALYRIDVNEKMVKRILTIENPDNLVDTITDLIIQREIQKVTTRMQYKNQSL